jgi:ATP-dependent Zn protease
MTNRTRRWPLMLAFLLLEFFTIGPESKAASQDSTAVSKLLSASKLAAFQLSKDTADMEGLAEANVSWTSNADSIEQIREDVNFMGQELAKLDKLKDTASPWQSDAIAKLHPLMLQLASNTTIVIDELNEDHQHFNTSTYKKFVAANADEAGELSKMLADFVSYGKTKHKFEKLGSRIDIGTAD